jgi:PAS domain S-box-containing protein
LFFYRPKGLSRFLDVNEKACLDLGYTRQEMLSMTAYDINPAFNDSVRNQVDRKLRQSGFAIIESRHRRKDGSTFPVEINIKYVRLDRGYIVTVVRELTQRKQATEALKKSEEKFSKAFRESPLVLTLTSARGERYIEVNENYEHCTGFRREEVIGRTPADLVVCVDPGQRTELTNRLLAGGCSQRRVPVPRERWQPAYRLNFRAAHRNRGRAVCARRHCGHHPAING